MSWNPGAQLSPPPSHDPPDYLEAVRDTGFRSSDSILSTDSQDTVHLTPSHRSASSAHSGNGYDAQSQGVYSPWGEAGILSSSTLSLGPSESSDHGRRQLLLIYIHGFMGAETSFQKFPAHVHNLVTMALKETHVVYSKVYPRYKSRRALNIARDDFSHWLSPHESENTDVILLGHSLGGILTAEVALMHDGPTISTNLFKHRILGLINFDVPFLGMHPGVIGTGLSSLFQPKSKDQSPSTQVLEDESSSVGRSDSVSSGLSSISLDDRSASPFELGSQDPNFDPAFPNDVHNVKRSQLDGALNFLKKYSGKLPGAIKDYLTSYFEFGGCLADYSGLHTRYRQLKQFEATDDFELTKDSHGRLIRRIRFVNYYTASTGFPKEISPAKPLEDTISDSQLRKSSSDVSVVSNKPVLGKEQNAAKLPSPLISVHSSDDDDSLDEMEPTPIEEEDDLDSYSMWNDSKTQQETTVAETDPLLSTPTDNGSGRDLALALDSLPPLPPLPKEPAAFDPSLYDDKDTLKVAQKEYSRFLKAYERSKKDHDKALKDRQKLIRKLERKQLEKQKSSKGENKKHKEDEEVFEEAVTTTPVKRAPPPLPPRPPPAPKDRKFCALPSGVDPLWVRVFMPDVDEVVAHQSMFTPNGTYYERLVGDTASRIEEWVQDDSTRRVIWEQLEAEVDGSE